MKTAPAEGRYLVDVPCAQPGGWSRPWTNSAGEDCASETGVKRRGLPIEALGDISKLGMTGYETGRVLVHPNRPCSGEQLRSRRSRAMTVRPSGRWRFQRRDELYLISPSSRTAGRRLGRTMSHLHFNDNFRYNSQSTSALMTTEPSIGRRGWLNVRMENEKQEKEPWPCG